MSSASEKVPRTSPPYGTEGGIAGPPDPPKGSRLRLIRTHLSDNGQCIHVSFIGAQDHAMTVLLEIATATQFHHNLGTLLNQVKALNQLTATEASEQRWN